MSKIIRYNVDVEEPICTRCDYCTHGEDFCDQFCGSEHGWGRYTRTEEVEDEEDEEDGNW